MKKMYILLLGFIFLNIGFVAAQPDPPTDLVVRLSIEPEYEPHVLLGWNENQQGVDHFVVFLDGVVVPDNITGGGPYWTQGFAYFLTQNVPGGVTADVYHIAGIIAIDNNGLSSDTATFHFYFSETAYAHPYSLGVVNSLETGNASFTWNKPPYGGGAGQPAVINYNVYLDGNYVSTTTDEQFSFTGLTLGTTYVAGVTTNYSDGYSDSIFYPNYAKKEFYFDTLAAPVNPTINGSNGIFNWGQPYGDNDIIGGTFIAYPWGIDWACSWPDPEENYIAFGDEQHFVNSRWKYWSWVHNWPKYDDQEGLWLEWYQIDPQPSFNYALADVETISEINNAGNLSYDLNQNVLDATTNPSGIGGFVVHYNAESGYYGVLRMDDVYDRQDDPECVVIGKVDFTWWFQTNGSDDFSGANNYYPESYNIYLDGEFIANVVTGTLEGNPLEYQFENLVSGQFYTAGIEAVYYVGKSEMVNVDFTTTVGISNTEAVVNSTLKVFPNPVVDQALITFSLHESQWVAVEIFNLFGVKIKTLVNNRIMAGNHQLVWDMVNDAGEMVAPGFYFCTLRSGSNLNTIKLLVE